MAWEHMRILSESISWLLGPFNGNPRERLSGISPSSLFMTGMIASPADGEIQVVGDFTGEEEITGVEDESTLDTSPAFPVNPVLHPDKLPASLGLTFAVRCSERKVRFRTCITWARYMKEKSPENEKQNNDVEAEGTWTRYPACEIIEVELDPGNRKLTQRLTDENGSELELRVRVMEKGTGLFTVSVHLVARGPVPPRHYTGRPPSRYVIFQPQIRVVLGEGCSLADMSDTMRTWTTEFDVPFLEEGLEIPARGHMCSVIWKDIDPQQLMTEELPEDIVYPFRWPDGGIVQEKYGEEAFQHFLHCDLRTEYIPVVEVPSPDLDPIPSVRADDLAEAWDPQKMEEILQPFIRAYSEWIEKREREIPEGNERKRNILDRHRIALDRMKRSLNLLLEDDNIRLAFCFANRALSLQYSWGTPGRDQQTPFTWRPFQLGFFLLVLESLCDPGSSFRKTCDLLWIPTGGGKTEAYLGIIAFMLALRRRKHGEQGLGTTVISRYTLRLLGIQQFMRALRLVTACEYLRLQPARNGLHGWRPEKCNLEEDWLWGKEWFSAGLWVGGRITPNRLRGNRREFWGARDILEDLDQGRRYRGGETPAQVTACPACGTLLAVPESDEGIPWGDGTVWFIVRVNTEECAERIREELSDGLRMQLQEAEDLEADLEVIEKLVDGEHVYALGIYIMKNFLRGEDLDRVWREVEAFLQECSPKLLSFSPRTPGYFPWGGDDFRIVCPSPSCYLRGYRGQYVREFRDTDILSRRNTDPDVLPVLRNSIHIPALTVDEQIYRELPSLLIATVDKFARLPAEPRCAAIFGNVNRFHQNDLFYRSGVGRRGGGVEIPGFLPPELILQDELHLIEGPLGSLAGLYETAVDFLCSEEVYPPKYIASTATTKGGGDQIRALFAREAFLFPPQGIRFGDNFFTRTYMEEPGTLFRNPDKRGRIYAGIASFAWGPLTPQVRLAASIYSAVHSPGFPGNLRSFYITPVSYYNAVRELAAGLHLFYQDIPDWFRSSGRPHLEHLPRKDRVIELSGRISSGVLPFILKMLEAARNSQDPPDALLTTSIFGTGVDIPHLSLMIVNGQPKTTSSYIQATGRVGRSKTGIVFTLYRVSRPRDLSHYEFFSGYHRAMYRYVEEATVFPFSRRCLERGSGGVAVSLLRLSRFSGSVFGHDDSACLLQYYGHRGHQVNRYVDRVVDVFLQRNRDQPEDLRIHDTDLEGMLRGRNNGFDWWREVARANSRQDGCRLRYTEYFRIENDVVLGDLQHERAGRRCVYRRAPSSLRTVEDEIEIWFTPR